MAKPWNTGLGWIVAIVGLILAILTALGAISLSPVWLIVLCFIAILL
jgi:hypothetical protein